jgi:S-adenosylmethionine:tRNA ribosyltransferase-isomerase
MIAPPRELRASLPAELRGVRRDGARLCVVERASGRIFHTTVARLGEHLAQGDVLVVNSSRTLPAALTVTRDSGVKVQLRPGAIREGEWDALAVETTPPHRNVALARGEVLRAGNAGCALSNPWRRSAAVAHEDRAWRSAADAAHRRRADPVFVRPDPVALTHYQTVYAGVRVRRDSVSRTTTTWEPLSELRRGGVDVTDIVPLAGSARSRTTMSTAETAH